MAWSEIPGGHSKKRGAYEISPNFISCFIQGKCVAAQQAYWQQGHESELVDKVRVDSMEINEVMFNENGEILDILTGDPLKGTPEERVRQQGQFFTNRLVVDMMVKILDPQIGEHALDPAGGSGGFATGIFRHLRRKVIASTVPGTPARERQLTTIKDSVYLVGIAARLVKIAKCAMLLTVTGNLV